MNRIDSTRLDAVVDALLKGSSIREAAVSAGCAKGTAERYRRTLDEINFDEDGFTTRRTGKRKKDGSCEIAKVTALKNSPRGAQAQDAFKTPTRSQQACGKVAA